MSRVTGIELDEGEAEAIALALESKAGLILLDERRARRRAAELGLIYTGVLGVVLKAKRRGFVGEVRPLLEAIRNNAGFWVSDHVFRRALELAGEK